MTSQVEVLPLTGLIHFFPAREGLVYVFMKIIYKYFLTK